MTEMRKDRRAPASLKVKYKSATVDDFIEQFGTDVSRGGIFIKTKKPLEAGALLKFEFQLQDGSAVLHGVGRVAWRRLEQQARPDLPAGMGIKFFKLSDQSRVVVERIESRYTGNKSRYELTESAEFAPPMSGPPNAADSGASQLPGNGRRPGTGSAPRTLPPPPAVSSIPPALADVPPSRTPIRPSLRGAGGPVSPKAVVGSFFPETPVRKPSAPVRQSGSPVRASGSPVNRARDASEFLASAFQAGGAGPEVRAQARAQAERARRDPESVDLARELFGDMGDSPAAASAVAAGLTAGLGTNANNTPTHRPPPSGGVPANDFGFNTPVPAVELPRSPVPRNSRPSLADRIPSIEQLVDEAGRSEASSTAPSGAALAASAGASLPAAAAPAAGATPEPLKLQMQIPTQRPVAAEGEAPAGKSRLLLFVALASTLVLGGVAAYVVMQRSSAAPRDAQAALDKTLAAAAPTQPPTAANPVAPQPAAQPATAESAPVPGPEVSLAIETTPRAAEVWIGDTKHGSAPLTVKLPSNVPVEVSVRSAGFASVKRSITPREGGAPESFELAPLPYQLVVTSDPAAATIAADGKSAVSPAPLELGHIAGPIAITIDKEGFQRIARSMKLDEFHEQDGVMRAEITQALTPLPAARRRIPRVVAAIPAAPGDAPPAPENALPPPVMQVKPEGDAPAAEPPAAAPTSAPEAKVKPAEPPQTAAAPDPPPPPPEPAPN